MNLNLLAIFFIKLNKKGITEKPHSNSMEPTIDSRGNIETHCIYVSNINIFKNI